MSWRELEGVGKEEYLWKTAKRVCLAGEPTLDLEQHGIAWGLLDKWFEIAHRMGCLFLASSIEVTSLDQSFVGVKFFRPCAKDASTHG